MSERNADLEAERDNALDAKADAALENIRDELDQAIRRVVTDQVGHENWPGDVDPPSSFRFDEALRSILRQLIENGTPEARDSECPKCDGYGGRVGIVDGECQCCGFKPSLDSEALGLRVTLIRNIERYPHFIARADAAGSVVEWTKDLVRVRMDEHLPGAEEWQNEVVWTPEDEYPGKQQDARRAALRDITT